jgi:hypothetical protein
MTVRSTGCVERIVRLGGGVCGKVLVMGCLRGGVVSHCWPGREQEQNSRVIEAVNRVALTGLERHQRSRFARHGLSGCLDRDSARNDFDDGAFADPMVGKGLAAKEVEDHDPAFGRCEEHARLLVGGRRYAGRFGARVALSALVGRSGKRRKVPVLHTFLSFREGRARLDAGSWSREWVRALAVT